MAVDFFIKIGDIKGEAMDSAHKDEIDVASWNWGAAQQGTFAAGGGGGAGKVAFHDMTFTHYIDKATPPLFMACAAGTHIKEALLTCRKAGGDAQVEYLKIKLSDLLVSSVNSGAARGGDEIPVETVALNFAKVEIEYQQQNADGSKFGGPVKAGWDLKSNKKV
jgi:type VI secretion system secreted protein Hcp